VYGRLNITACSLLNCEVTGESHRRIPSFGAVGGNQDDPEHVNAPTWTKQVRALYLSRGMDRCERSMSRRAPIIFLETGSA
jgi:hypothetical protein